MKKQERGKKERIALVYRSGFRTILSLIGKRKTPRRGEMEGKDDNIVTRDANFVETLMDDPTTMKLDRRTSMNCKKIRPCSFTRSLFEPSDLCELIFGVYIAQAILFSFRSTR